MLLPLLLADRGLAQEPKNHLTFALGYEKLTNDDLQKHTYSPDLSSATYWSVAYRRSKGSKVDVTIDLRGTWKSTTFVSPTFPAGSKWSMTTVLFGPGVRYTFSPRGVRPHAQVNLFLSGTGGDQPTSFSESGGIGIGLTAGIDLALTRTISIPIEVNYTPIEFVSGEGVNAGLTFNW